MKKYILITLVIFFYSKDFAFGQLKDSLPPVCNLLKKKWILNLPNDATFYEDQSLDVLIENGLVFHPFYKGSPLDLNKGSYYSFSLKYDREKIYKTKMKDSLLLFSNKESIKVVNILKKKNQFEEYRKRNTYKVSKPYLLRDSLFTFLSKENEIVTMNAIKKEKLWTKKIEDKLIGEPFYANDKVIWITTKGITIANKLNGTQLWNKKFTGTVASNYVIDGSFLYLAVQNEGIYKINIKDNSIVWNKKDIPQSDHYHLLSKGDEIIIVIDGFTSLSKSTGSLLWKSEIKDMYAPERSAVAGNYLIFYSALIDGEYTYKLLSAFNTKTKKVEMRGLTCDDFPPEEHVIIDGNDVGPTNNPLRRNNIDLHYLNFSESSNGMIIGHDNRRIIGFEIIK